MGDSGVVLGRAELRAAVVDVGARGRGRRCARLRARRHRGRRRGPDAFDRFVAYYNESNFAVFLEDPASLDPIEQLVAEHPGVETSATTTFVTLGDVEPDGSIARTGVAAGMIAIRGDADIERPAIVRGRRPETAFEVAVNDRVAARRHLEPGGCGSRCSVPTRSTPSAAPTTARAWRARVHGDRHRAIAGRPRVPSRSAAGHDLPREMYWYPGALWKHFDGDVANYGVGVLAQVAPTADTAALEDEARRSTTRST